MPKWLYANQKKKSQDQEKTLANEIGANLTASSGATPFAKGDMTLGNILIESKSTKYSSISLKQDWLAKIEREALSKGKLPLLILEMNGRRYYVFREEDIDLGRLS